MVPYSLIGKEQSSGSFYIMLNIFTDIVLDEAYIKLGNYSGDYWLWVDKNKIEKPRTKEEYLLELITIGVLWNNYSSKALQTGKFAKKTLSSLYSIRKKYPALKNIADTIRGITGYYLLEKKKRYRVKVYTKENYEKLLEWLSATGEFNEEVVRLRQWYLYFDSLTEAQVHKILHKANDMAISFTDMGRSVLGGFTQNVDRFRDKARVEYKFREDYFFVQRMENEYFLNMFGAEVLNRQLKKGFDKAPNKAILLPKCMRGKVNVECKAVSDGKELVCKVCNKNCGIGKIAREFANDKVKVYLIPHSSNFSRFLAHWANQDKTALVGVACVLNLLTGGYEMKRLNIASQCVFLDYCSCKKHWNKHGIPTNLNTGRLKQLMVPEKTLVGDGIVTIL